MPKTASRKDGDRQGSTSATTHVRVPHLVKRWSVPAPTIYRWLDQNLIGYARVGRVILVPVSEVERFEQSSFIAASEAPVAHR